MKTSLSHSCFLALITAIFASSASAISVTNAGFEDPAKASGAGTWQATPPGWSYATATTGSVIGQGVQDMGGFLFAAAEGENVGFLYHNGSGSTPSTDGAMTLSQTVDPLFMPYTTYTLTVKAAWYYSFPTSATIGIYNATTTANGLLTSPLSTTAVTNPGTNLFGSFTVTYTTGAAPPSGPVVIGLSITHGLSDPAAMMLWDDVQVSAVPVHTPVNVPIANAGFENPAYGPDLGSWRQTPPSWSYATATTGPVIAQGVQDETGPAHPLDAPEGDNWGYLYHNGTGSDPATDGAMTFYQQVGSTFAPGTTYALTVKAGYFHNFPTTATIGIYNSTATSNGLLTSPMNTAAVTTPGANKVGTYLVTFTTGSVAPSGPVVIGLSITHGLSDPTAMMVWDDIKLITISPLPAFETWALGYELDPLTTGAANADPDHDGIQNSIEFVTGTVPTVGNFTPPVETVFEGTTIYAQFRRAIASTYLNPVIQTSTTLAEGSWTDVTTGITIDPDGVGYERVYVTIDDDSSPRRFIRLKTVNP